MIDNIKAKGDELVERFRDDPFTGQISSKNAVACAIIAVEEIIKACSEEYDSDLVHWKETGGGEFWNEVINYLKSKL